MNIAIIGCGYIGMEVARLWKERGHQITATTRHPEKIELLSKVAQRVVVLKSNNEEELAPLIAENELILVTIAADSPDHYESTYLHTSQNLKKTALELGFSRKLIYTSSSSVYGDQNGHWVDETAELKGDSPTAKSLIDTEKNFRSLEELGWQVCILRFSEIYGPGRELSERVKGFKDHTLAGIGDYYSNMVHKKDCVHAIDFAFRHHLEGIYNLSDDEHPTRKDLYDTISHKFQLPLVKWDENHTPLRSGNKRVSNHKIKTEGFAFCHAHRILD